MPTTFAVDENNDLYIGPDGNLAIVTGLEAVLQACATRVKAQLGEMVLAIGQGVPNFQIVWGGIVNYPQFEAIVRNVFLSVPNVLDVLDFQILKIVDTLQYTALILTTFGQGEISG